MGVFFSVYSSGSMSSSTACRAIAAHRSHGVGITVYLDKSILAVSSMSPHGLTIATNIWGHVTQVCVLPEYRGKKIGESLLAATQANLRKRNFSALSLTVTEANNKAVALYRRLNFDSKRVFDAFVWEG